MCLGIPMKITTIDRFMAQCEAKGIYRDVSLFMLQDEMPEIGDFVVVHVGYAIEKVSQAQALSSWEVFDQILAAEDKLYAAKDKLDTQDSK